jgi:hypothetical protein
MFARHSSRLKAREVGLATSAVLLWTFDIVSNSHLARVIETGAGKLP